MLQPHIHAAPAFAGLRIGLLGGSFNPAHQGHLAISLFALKRLSLDQIWWLVSPQNPLKPVKGMASFEKRYEEAQKIARHPQILVSAIERNLGMCFTADTLTALIKRFPKTHFVWLMGADNLRQIPRWRNWQDIFMHAPIAVFRRPLFPVGCGTNKAVQRFARAFRPPSFASRLALAPPPVWLVLDNPLNVKSSTALRLYQQAKEPPGRDRKTKSQTGSQKEKREKSAPAKNKSRRKARG